VSYNKVLYFVCFKIIFIIFRLRGVKEDYTTLCSSPLQKIVLDEIAVVLERFEKKFKN